MAFDFIQQQRQQRQQAHRFRSLTPIEQSEGMHIKVAGKAYVNFSSNDYLGLNQHSEVKKALQTGADRFGPSASSASLITGNHYAHRTLQAQICQWVNKPRCLLYSSGFAANVGALHALGDKSSEFYLDKLSHASLIDGAYTSQAKVKRFLHNDHQQLTQLLKQSSSHNKLIVTEGIFSMDGDQANWPLLSQVANAHNAWVYADDAHAIGVVGEQGQGSISKCDIDIVMATFGKALASSGAFIACNDDVADHLTNFSRHYIYSTAISPALAWATIKSIELAQQENWRREKIKQLSELFSSTLDQSIQLLATDSSIHGVVIGSEQKTLQVSQKLKNDGFWVSAIRPPTVANNSSRLRVTISALHIDREIKALANSINEALLS